jgi:hypothetical protein
MTNLITPPLELVQRVATTLHGVTNSDLNAPVDELNNTLATPQAPTSEEI